MKLSGSYQINLSKEKVWKALNDPEILKLAIPGCEEFIKNSDTEFTATATNKIANKRNWDHIQYENKISGIEYNSKMFKKILNIIYTEYL